MQLSSSQSLEQEDARAIVRRAIDKAEELGLGGYFVVVDGAGSPLTASRMDGAGGAAYALVRAKAYTTAVNRVTGESFADRMAMAWRVLGVDCFSAYQRILREQTFPAYGAIPVRRNGQIVGGYSSGGELGPRAKLPGVEARRLIVDGKPTNSEDLIGSYALDIPYSPQHGDDTKRWVDAYGAVPDGSDPGCGLAPAPPASKQHSLSAAMRLCDAVLEEACKRQVSVSVVITDHLGDVVQLDRMADAPPMGPDIAEALAVTAANTRRSTAGLIDEMGELQFKQLAEATPYKLLALPGGYPLEASNKLIGAVGVSGTDLSVCNEIAKVAVDLFNREGVKK